MKNLIVLLGLILVFTSCEKSSPLDDYTEIYGNALDSLNVTPTTLSIDYEFNMVGRCQQDNNGYYQLTLNPGSNQTLHRFGAHITNTDIYGLPSQVIWSCESYWMYNGHTVPVVNGTSFADPNMDSIFCMMAPVFSMQGDTITIYGQAWFEEGDIILKDSINVIFK